MALEYHSVEVPWWDDIVTGLPKPLVKDGFIPLPNKIVQEELAKLK